MKSRLPSFFVGTPRPRMAVPLLLGVAALPALAQVTTYDPTSQLVTIPSVSVGSASYTQVTLKDIGNYTFTLQGAVPQTPAAPGAADYDLATGILTLPAVKVGATTFIDVKLLNTGNFTFTLQAASELPAGLPAALQAWAAATEAPFATAVPATGAQRSANFDACWAEDGRTLANFIADWNTNSAAYVQRNAFQIGRKVQNVQVLAVRNKTNADGSTRQEVDVGFDLTFADGTVQQGRSNLISGSSAGTPGCSSAQTGSALRTLGNQRLAQANVRYRVIRDERRSLTTGEPLSPAVNYRRAIRFDLNDPMGNATHAIVTGPGPAATVNGAATQFSLKLLSPRLQRSAPELQGKQGNFLNWGDDEAFRYCRGGTVPVAQIADCVANGTGGNDWGWTTSTPNAAADDGFAGQGWVAGGVYRFDLYNDDGWKTVNGHVGRTPIATYYDTLTALPPTFVTLAGTGGTDVFPKLSFGAMSAAQVATNAVAATPAALSVSWTAPTLAAPKLGLFQLWEFHQGPKVGNANNAFNPALRSILYQFPGTAALSINGWPVSPLLTDQARKTYTEYSVFYNDRNDAQVASYVSFQ